MKTKIFLIVLCFFFLRITTYSQVQLRSDNKFMVGYNVYTPITLGYYTDNGTNNGAWAIEWYDNGLNIWKPWPSPNFGNYFLFIRDDNGSVGIGKRPTAGKLDVAGDIYAKGIKLSSDARLKTNIIGLTSCMDKLSKLNGKSYTKSFPPKNELNLDNIKDSVKYQTILHSKENRKNDESGKEFGFIGQELNEIFPELVQEDSLGYLYIDYISLIPVIVEALKEQNTNINSKDSLIKTLTDQVSILQKISKSQEQSIISLQQQIKNCCSSKTKSSQNNDINTNINSDTNKNKTILYQNSPNPFNQTTQIAYFIDEYTSSATLYIYNMNGLQIKAIPIHNKGIGNVTIDSSELQPGMYLYTLIVDGTEIDTKRMILTK